MTYRLIHGACADVLAGFPDNFFDAHVGDPPYGLGTRDPTPQEIAAYLRGDKLRPLRQGSKHCANSVLRAAIVSQAYDSIPEVGQDCVPFRVVCTHLSAVLAGGVEFENEFVGKQKINHKGTISDIDHMLVREVDLESLQPFDDCQFSVGVRESFTGCVKVCRCFTQLSESTVCIAVRLDYNAWSNADGSSVILTGRATKIRAVLRLDMARHTGELLRAEATDESDAGLELAPSTDVRTNPRACGLATTLQQLMSGKVRLPTNRTLSFNVSLPTTLVRRFHETSVPQKDFMGKQWEIPTVADWRAIYRVLKPGAYCAAFSSPRTWDLVSLGMRAAGFRLVDTVMAPCLFWVHGQGWPKGISVGKAIDAMLGAEREVVGTKLGLPGYSLAPSRGSNGDGIGGTGDPARECEVTTPATPEAARYEQYFSQLKPGWEPVLLFQKPLSEPTVAANVLRWGVGAFNVGACRVGTAPVRTPCVRTGAGNTLGLKDYTSPDGFTGATHAGRYPTNLLLMHLPTCRQVGEREVPSNGDVSGDEPSATTKHAYGEGERRPWQAHGQGGVETVPVWECAPGCQSAELDSQGGYLHGAGNKGGTPKHSQGYGGGWSDKTMATSQDRGGFASRFFPSIVWDEDDLHAFQYCAKVKTAKERGEGNTHVAVKPTQLLRWLSRLLCPMSGTILDPFMGSGSGGVAAVREGFNYVGIERDAEWLPVARRRITRAARGK